MCLASHVQGAEHIGNRATKIVGRDMLSDLAEVARSAMEQDLGKVLEATEAQSRAIDTFVSRNVSLFTSISLAITLRILGRIARGQIGYQELREVCRECVRVYRPRVPKEVAIAIAAINDFDLLILNVLPRLGIRKFRSLVRSRARDVYGESVERSISLALHLLASLSVISTNRRISEAVLSELYDMSKDLESYIDTLALALDPDNDSVYKALTRGE